MAQFQIHANVSPGASPAIPWLLDLQSPLLSDLRTRIVAPVYRRAHLGGAIPTGLGVEIVIDDEPCVAMLLEMAAIPVRYLGQVKLDLGHQRSQLVRALDLLFSGM